MPFLNFKFLISDGIFMFLRSCSRQTIWWMVPHNFSCIVSVVLFLGMHRIAIFIIRPEPDSTGYQINYPAGTGTGTGYRRIYGYLLHNSQFLVCLEYSVLSIKMCYALCLSCCCFSHTLHSSTTSRGKKILGLHST